MTAIRLSKLAILVLTLLAAGSVAQTPAPANSPSITPSRDADSYAIYSLLINDGSVGDISRRSQPLAIADTTLSVDDRNAAEPDSEVQPPPGSERAFQEAVQDYHARHQERVQLEPRFHIARPSTLLSEERVAQFRKTLTRYPSILLFSEVYFNARQTAALVYTDSLCRNSCPSGRWIYLEKRDGQWHRPSNSTGNAAADTYAIYSLLLHDDPYPGLPQKQGQLAIADTTINITDMNPAIPPDGQLQPPPNNAEAFREAVQDFRARRFERLQLKRDFHLDVDYTLLNPGDVAAYESTQTGYPAVNFFSEVYFDSTKTAALVYRNTFCGHLCANSGWIYLEKQNGQWVRRSGLNI